ncbi:MAG: hypothetical protein Q8S32_12205 [Burkholderiaceae bacterium]|nr:hypothetical protein [Burkholderiaceae bacterium]
MVKKIWIITRCIDCNNHQIKDNENYCFDKSRKVAWKKIVTNILKTVPNWCPLEDYPEELENSKSDKNTKSVLKTPLEKTKKYMVFKRNGYKK